MTVKLYINISMFHLKAQAQRIQNTPPVSPCSHKLFSFLVECSVIPQITYLVMIYYSPPLS